MKIDFFASWPHYEQHMRPVWDALPLEMRGEFMVGQLERNDSEVIAVGAYRDLRHFRQAKKRVLIEHGAGQSYSTKHPAYSGGAREPFDLHLVPRAEVGDESISRVGIIGPTHMARVLAPRQTGDTKLVVQSFHWECAVSPEAGTSFWDYVRHIDAISHELRGLGYEYALHAHPRIDHEVAQFAKDFNIPYIRDFNFVMRHASLYAVDNSSTLFEFASWDMPVVVVNAKDYRRDVRHGLRFWDYADIGPQVDAPYDFVSTVVNELANPMRHAERRREVSEAVYTYLDDQAGARARELLYEL